MKDLTDVAIEINSSDPSMGSNSALLRMFQSEYFDMYLHMYYLCGRQDPQIHDYLIKLLYQRKANEVYYYLPQLCQMGLDSVDAPIRQFLVDIGSRSMNFALKITWNLQAAVFDASPKYSSEALRLKEQLEIAVINGTSKNPNGGDAETEYLIKNLFERNRLLNASYDGIVHEEAKEAARLAIQKKPESILQSSSISATNSSSASELVPWIQVMIEYMSHPIVLKNGKVIPSPFTYLRSPFNTAGLDLSVKEADNDELKPYIIKQKRCEYFNLVDKFVSHIIDLSEKLAGDADRTARQEILARAVRSLDEWIRCKIFGVAAMGGLFYLSGITLPLNKFSSFDFEDNEFLTRGHIGRREKKVNGVHTLQIIGVAHSECRVFSSRKRAPYLLVLELANLDEDLDAIEKLGHTQDLYSYKLLFKYLVTRNLYRPPFSDRPITENEYGHIMDEARSAICCKVCYPQKLCNGVTISISGSVFECNNCGGTMVYHDAITTQLISHSILDSLRDSETTRLSYSVLPSNNDSFTEPIVRLPIVSDLICTTDESELNSPSDRSSIVDSCTPTPRNNVSGSTRSNDTESSVKSPYKVILEANDNEKVRELIWGESWLDKEKRCRDKSPLGLLKSYRLAAVIVKSGDELRQELLASQIIRLCRTAFGNSGLPLWLHSYDTLVTGGNCGMMEYIPDTQSLDAIKQKFSVENIYNVFQIAFGDCIPTAQRNFIESHAAYSLVGYILQVKDRHNGNLLLNRCGRIIHIDYGFMLSNSPGYVNFETSPFKLSPEIMSIMGGAGSENFEYFKEIMVRGFLEIRRYAEQIILLVRMVLGVSKMPCFAGAPQTALQNLKDRLMVSCTQNQCVTKVLGLIDASVNNWRTTQYDNYQRYTNGIM